METPAMDSRLRIVCAGIGAALLAAGSRRRTAIDMVCGAVGSGMLIWAMAAPAPKTFDMVDISSEDSFPASDPPSTW